MEEPGRRRSEPRAGRARQRGRAAEAPGVQSRSVARRSGNRRPNGAARRSRVRSRRSSERATTNSRLKIASRSACGVGPSFAIDTRRSTSRSRCGSRIARRPVAAFTRPTSRASSARSFSSRTIRRSRASIRRRSRRSSAGSAAPPRPSTRAQPPNRSRRSPRARAGSRACPGRRSTRRATSWRKFTCRNGSRVDGSDRWTSQNGRSTPSSASRRATRRVGQPAGVDDRDVEVALVEPVDQGALVVRLEEVDRRAPARPRARRSRRGCRRACRGRRSPARASRAGSGSGPGGRGRGSRARPPRPSGRREQRRRGPLDDVGRDVGPDDRAVRRRQDPAQRPAGVLLVGRRARRGRSSSG